MKEPTSIRCKTVFKKCMVDEAKALHLYKLLKDSISWEDGIRSRNGFTRKAKYIQPGANPDIDEVIAIALSQITDVTYCVTGIYLNYYETGEMYTPNHSHKGTHQLIVSLGGKRTLAIGKRKFPMENGDAIIFGASTHGVPKEPNIQEGRISIATFMVPEKNIKIQVENFDDLLESLNGMGLSDEELAKKLQAKWN